MPNFNRVQMYSVRIKNILVTYIKKVEISYEFFYTSFINLNATDI